MLSSSKAIRGFLRSRVLRTGVLALTLPTFLLASIQAEVLLLHSDCKGSTHLHSFAATDPNEWQSEHPLHNPCCDSAHDERDAVANGPDTATGCDHDKPIVVLVKGVFTATIRLRASGELQLKVVRAPLLVTVSGDLSPRTLVQDRSPGDREGGYATGDAVATILLRNHALLL